MNFKTKMSLCAWCRSGVWYLSVLYARRGRYVVLCITLLNFKTVI